MRTRVTRGSIARVVGARSSQQQAGPGYVSVGRVSSSMYFYTTRLTVCSLCLIRKLTCANWAASWHGLGVAPWCGRVIQLTHPARMQPRA